jgi:DNA repair exonuclease SbcCD ATPase subunit
MIPRRITVNGFLCYKDEQVIDLDGRALWVFSGRNGSGKSAVFDAMTYALFKAHRGGRQDFTSLVHAEADELSVCFEFDLGPERYRIRRGYRKGKADQCVYRREPQPDGSERWPAVPETDSDTGLKTWVRQNVGLTYETFTASVLLLQGKADALLGVQPAERFKILSGIVDLESYQRLHKLADHRRQAHKARAEERRKRLQALPVIEPAAAEAAATQLGEAAAVRAAAEARWKYLVGVAAQAGKWLDLTQRRIRAEMTREHSHRLVAESATIARDWARLQELDAALPVLRGAIERRRKIAQAEAEALRADGAVRVLARRLDLIAALTEDNRRHLDSVVAEIANDERRHHAVLERQAALAAPISRANQARALAEEVRKLGSKLAAYPADLAEQAAALEQEHQRCVEWKAALSPLENLAREREGLAAARGWIAASRRETEELVTRVQRASADLAARHTVEEAARDDEAEARNRRIEAETRRQSAAERLAAFSDLQGEPRCDRCGQELTPVHFAAEEARLRDEHRRAAEAAERIGVAYQAATQRLDTAASARERARQAHEQAVKDSERASRALDKAEEDAGRHARTCRNAFDQLEAAFRLRVAAGPPGDWLTTTFPSPDDLAEGRARAQEEPKVRARWEAVRKDLDGRRTAEGLLMQARHTLDSIGLQAGDQRAEAEHAALQAERDALDRCLAGHRVQKALAEDTNGQFAEQGRRFRDDHQAALRARDGALNLAAVQAQEQARARAGLRDERWRIAFDSAAESDVEDWDRERESFRAAGLEARAKELPGAHLRLTQAEEEVARLDAELAAISPEARTPPAEVAAEVSEAERACDQADEVRRKRQGELDSLREAREARRILGEETLAAEHDHAVSDTLARLLGPRGLQRALIRDAEHAIVALANPILRDISGGELELRLLESDADDQALRLEALVRTHGRTRAHDVAYLSGSQKFRAAVSLALAIGQYARGNRERPIESVIIDEGFGSLDPQGRDEMIEELKALDGRLARIILVSHQEEFAQAFPDGYRFEVVDGSTVARPFLR